MGMRIWLAKKKQIIFGKPGAEAWGGDKFGPLIGQVLKGKSRVFNCEKVMVASRPGLIDADPGAASISPVEAKALVDAFVLRWAANLEPPL
jgi:hypothetical protein